MTSPTSGSLASRFSFSDRAQLFSLGEKEPRVYGYSWRHPEPLASIVLVHGLLSHAQWFAESADLLLDRGLSVYAVERRGSGASPAEPGQIGRYFEWFEEIARVVELAQAEQPAVPAHLVGHCFGANVAIGCALTQPVEVASIAMLTPGLYVRPDYPLGQKLRILAHGLARSSRRFRVPQRAEHFTRDSDLIAWIEGDEQGAQKVTAHCLLEARAMLAWLRRHLGELGVPVLVLEAGRDRISINVRNRAALEGALGERCRWATFDAEHFLLTEPCRDEVLEELSSWVSEHGGSA